MASTNVPKRKDPPEIIVDKKNKRTYIRSSFLGKGGFAKCYELIDQSTKEKFAGKVVPKAALIKPTQKEKMHQEISIHRTLKHPNIVGFYGYFDDDDFIYIVLELCNFKSLLELHKCRRYITEPEARYFLKQIVIGCQYLHLNKVIHRDLKLANLFLSGDMVVKIGDFGLASRIVHDGEKKKTLCGTPNYIAPEILTKGGHSFEVDCWSLGCILYTLLVGSPPFETNKLEETYSRIKHNDYRIPYKILPSASNLIAALLNPDPQKRPNMFTILDHEFFKEYIPPCLPTSVLSTCPRFVDDEQMPKEKRALLEPNYIKDTPISSGGGSIPKPGTSVDFHPEDYWLDTLKREIQTLLSTAKILEDANAKAMEESESPACCPIYWVSKWVDYSDKYGLGYQLCDNSSGVVFNDVTRLILASNLEHFQYIDDEGTEIFFTASNRPENLEKKVTLLNYFKVYMVENLLKAGENANRREADNMARLPFLRRWFRTSSAMVLHLSNGTLQINFFEDHVKLILCPLLCAVTCINSTHSFHTYQFKLLCESGIIADLAGRLNYAIAMIDQLNTPLSQMTGTKSKPYEAPQKGSASTSAGVRKATAASAKCQTAISKPSS